MLAKGLAFTLKQHPSGDKDIQTPFVLGILGHQEGLPRAYILGRLFPADNIHLGKRAEGPFTGQINLIAALILRYDDAVNRCAGLERLANNRFTAPLSLVLCGKDHIALAHTDKPNRHGFTGLPHQTSFVIGEELFRHDPLVLRSDINNHISASGGNDAGLDLLTRIEAATVIHAAAGKKRRKICSGITHKILDFPLCKRVLYSIKSWHCGRKEKGVTRHPR